MSSSHVVVERKGEVAVLRLARPPANAIDMQLARDFETAFDAAVQGEPRALVLTGSGRFFSGGLDLKVVPGYSPDEQQGFVRLVNRLIAKLYACPLPLVGAINGHAVAGGFVVALTADYRIGPDVDALFGLTEARAGIPFPGGPMIVLRAELAPPDVRYAALSARNFDPVEARRRGFLDELESHFDVLPRALEVARDLASMPADAYRRIKRQLRGDAIAALEEMNATDADPMLRGWISDDAPQASAAILAQREPAR